MPKRENTRAILLCALYAFILLFFLSPDSYIRDLYGRCDSAWFFTCGKAWMNGMIPYVDFADSKGPLLWLIYGIGYLLSHHSYVGVFWVSIVFYTATLFFAYKTCRLFTNNLRSALVIALLPYFLFTQFHFEIRAEDFCETFLILGIYCLCLVLKNKDMSNKDYFHCSFGMGIAFAACLLIKWNNASMIALMAFAILWTAVRHGQFKACIIGLLTGTIVLTLPFIVYLAFYRALDDFFFEYFAKTLISVEDKETGTLIPLIKRAIKFSISSNRARLLIIVSFFTCWKYKTGDLWIGFCTICVVFLSAIAPWPHYYTMFTPLFVFFILPFVDLFFDRVKIERFIPIVVVFAAVFSLYSGIKHVSPTFKKTHKERSLYYRAAYVMSQIKKPKIMFCDQEQPIGVPVDYLPACKYWSLQWGFTPDMEEERHKALHNKKPDFVIYNGNEIGGTITLDEIKSQGYIFYCKTAGRFLGKPVDLYGRPGLRLPPDDFYVSDWDVWLKRNIFGI